MTEPRGHGPLDPRASDAPPGSAGSPRAGTGPTDAELDARGIVGFGIGLAILIAAVLGVVWLLSAGLKSVRVSHDPAPSPLPEANAPRVPPEPRLQTSPNDDMRVLREREDAVLTGYGPVDRTTGTARIPVDRAIEILARQGLPEPAPLVPQAPAAAPGSGASGAAEGDGASGTGAAATSSGAPTSPPAANPSGRAPRDPRAPGGRP